MIAQKTVDCEAGWFNCIALGDKPPDLTIHPESFIGGSLVDPAA